MTATEIIISFVANMGICMEALRKLFTSVERDVPTGPLFGRTPEGTVARRGRIDGVGTYRFHGVGCRFELEDGTDIDFDWNADGQAIFNGWRLRRFARSVGEADFSESDLIMACRELVVAGVLVEKQNQWFGMKS